MNLFAAAIFALAALTTSAPADISGKWQAEFDTQIGKQKYLYTFRVDGDKITGTAESEIQGEKRKSELKDVKLVGDDISFVETMDIMGNAITIVYKGRVSGNEMKLTRQVGDFATEELVARRVQEIAAAAVPATDAGPQVLLGR